MSCRPEQRAFESPERRAQRPELRHRVHLEIETPAGSQHAPGVADVRERDVCVWDVLEDDIREHEVEARVGVRREVDPVADVEADIRAGIEVHSRLPDHLFGNIEPGDVAKAAGEVLRHAPDAAADLE